MHPTVLEHIGDVYQMLGNQKKALEYYEQSLLKRQKGDNSELEEKNSRTETGKKPIMKKILIAGMCILFLSACATLPNRSSLRKPKLFC
ncbi:MAG: tetratricopeptide repeat protein [Desulfobacteraceae bacterium]|nr:tetratricopeptide repeat protein [Desulfobacteraceae bacterium]